MHTLIARLQRQAIILSWHRSGLRLLVAIGFDTRINAAAGFVELAELADLNASLQHGILAIGNCAKQRGNSRHLSEVFYLNPVIISASLDPIKFVHITFFHSTSYPHKIAATIASKRRLIGRAIDAANVKLSYENSYAY